MKTRWIVAVISGVVAFAVNNSLVYAQLPLGGAAGSAAAQAQAQAQQRIQAQVQQRVQTQIQQRAQAQVGQQVQAQLQARLQAEAARAAQIAQQAAAASQRQAAAVRSPGGINARVGAEANTQNQAQVVNQSANADAYARMGIDVNVALPPGITEADLKIYDNIFGRFNPLRAEPTPPAQPGQPAPQQSANSPPPNAPPQDTNRPGDRPGLNGEIGVAFASRITTAVRERRAEISQLRDRALATSDVQLMRHCEHLEQSMNAFAEAQARAQAEGGAAATTADRRDAAGAPEQRGPTAQGSGNGAANGNGAGGVRR